MLLFKKDDSCNKCLPRDCPCRLQLRQQTCTWGMQMIRTACILQGDRCSVYCCMVHRLVHAVAIWQGKLISNDVRTWVRHCQLCQYRRREWWFWRHSWDRCVRSRETPNVSRMRTSALVSPWGPCFPNSAHHINCSYGWVGVCSAAGCSVPPCQWG